MTFVNASPRLWASFKKAGMLTEIIPLAGSPLEEGDPVFVGWEEPDAMLGVAQSKQYQFEYLVSDMPDLAKGDLFRKGGEDYVVRQQPWVPENPFQGNDGTFKRAMLTKL